MVFWLILKSKNSLKNSIFIIILIFINSCDNIGDDYDWRSGPPGFNRHYGSIGYDYGWNAAYSPHDEGIVVVGQRSPEIGGQSDLWAIKTNNRGLMQWNKKFGGSAGEAGYDVISTSDGCFLFVGYTWSFGNRQQVYAIKTDYNGNVLWERTYGGLMWEVGNAVIEVNSGGYVIAGYSNSPGISSGNTDMYLIKIDNNGEIIWEKAYGNQAFPNHEWAYDLIQANNEDIIIVGSRDRYDNGSLNGLIYRIDRNGIIIWEKEILGDNQISESIYSISQSEIENENYFLCSGLNSTGSEDLYNPAIIKMDGFGNIDWQRTFKTNSQIHHQFRATSSITGGAVVAGSSTNLLSSGAKDDAFMIKVDNSGNIIWSNAYGSVDENDWGWSIFETPKNNLVLVGSTKSFGSSLFDIYLVGANADGISD